MISSSSFLEEVNPKTNSSAIYIPFTHEGVLEGEETKLAVGILSRMIKGEEVSDKEKSFLKEQSKDLARIIPLVAISGIPIPIPITPLLVMLGKKYGFDFLPKDHRGLLKDDEETPPVEDK